MSRRLDPGWIVAGIMIGERAAQIPIVQRLAGAYIAPTAVRAVRAAQRRSWPLTAGLEARMAARKAERNGWRFTS